MTRAYRWFVLATHAAALSVMPGEAATQVPLGADFQVNTYTTGSQAFAWPAAAGDGSAVIVWQDRQQAAVVRAYDPSGAPRGGELSVSGPGYGAFRPAAVARPAGYVVAWTGSTALGVFGRLLDPLGNPLGNPFRVDTYTSGIPAWARVAADSAGNFVVAWSTWGEYDIFARRFDASGVPVGAEFQVDLGGQTSALPTLAMTGDGRFVVAWRIGNDVVARRYDAQGGAAGPPFEVAPSTHLQQYPAAAMRPDGGFLVVWMSLGQDDPSSYGIQARLFDAAGAARGAEFRLNQVVADDQAYPALCADASGNFFAAWHSVGQDGSGAGIFARRITAAGIPMGTEFQVNSYTTGSQDLAAIGCDPAGNFIASWDSFGQDGDSASVFARRYGRFDPIGMDVDAKSGNGVFEPGETVEVAPEWRNFTHQGFPSVAGTASVFTGPAGATYTIADGTAGYGDVGAGQVATCELFEDCFALSVNAPPTRPVTHWDAQFVETLTIGCTHTWKVHLGGSFGDVPASSPFYRFIETVLHRGVTAGCQAASYCPAAPTLREQMPVMVLVAREGVGYQPPACHPGSEAFTDVPASSPFCRWIEELARRGVVGGCAQNAYCPGSAVSREQMAVFVLATLEAAGYVPPPCAGPAMFGDVPASSPFCRWIEELARRGVVSGCGNGNYCPSAAVTREQMSVFVAAGFGLTLYGP